MTQGVLRSASSPFPVAKFSSLVLAIGTSVLLSACFGGSAGDLVVSARKHVQANDKKAALIELKSALQKSPGLAEARFLLGELLFDSGDYVGAVVELQKAQELGYAPEQVLPLLAKAMYAKGPPEKVIEQFSSVKLSEAAAQAEILSIVAAAQLSAGHTADAKKNVEAALSADAKSSAAQLAQVRLLASSKDFEGASKLLTEVLKSQPNDSEAHRLRGDLFLLAGQRQEAAEAYKAAIKFNRRNYGAHTAILNLYLQEKDLKAADKQLAEFKAAEPSRPDVKWFGALLAVEREDFKSAGELSQQLLKIAPDNPQVLHLGGIIDLKAGAFVRAEAKLGRAVQMMPENVQVRLALAQTYLNMGDPAKALKALSPLSNNGKPNWEAAVLIAQAHMMQGDLAKAEAFYEIAANLNSTDFNSRTALALAQFDKGRAEQGLSKLSALTLSESGVTSDLALIGVYLRKKDYDAALLAVEQMKKKQPNSPIVSNLRGQIELQRGQNDAARQAFEATLKIDPGFVPSVLALASLDEQSGKAALAQTRLEKFVEANPQNVRVAMALSVLRAKLGAGKDELVALLQKTIKNNAASVAPRLALVDLYLQADEPKQALASAQQGLAQIPDNAELLDALGKSQFKLGELNQAISTYNKMAVLQPGQPEPHFRLAQIHLERKDQAAAAQSLRKALSVKGDYLPALRGLIGLELAMGKKSEALALAKSVQKSRPAESLGYAFEGDIAATQKDWPGAARAYRSGLDRQNSTELAIKLHKALQASGGVTDADKFSQQWIGKYPKDGVFRTYLGDRAVLKEDWDSALLHYQSLLAMSPESPSILNNLALIQNRKKKGSGLDLALKATQLDPGNASYKDSLAEIYFDNGNVAKAIETQSAALAAAPDRPWYRLHLAKYYLAAGDRAKASQELASLAALGDKFSGQAEVKALQAKL